MVDRRTRSAARGDEGISLVFIALSAVALILVAGLAIDGGVAYANRRQMQNAADAGAFAGTKAVEDLRFNNVTDGGTIYDAIDAARANNGGTAAKCYLVAPVVSPGVDPVRLSGDICTSRSAAVSAWTTYRTQAAGVEVEQTGVKKTFFSMLAGFRDTTARASATATIQPLAAGAGGSPFIVCASAAAGGFDIWDASNGSIKQSAIGSWYGLQGAQDKNVPDCGAGGSAFDGTGGEEPPVIGEWIDAGNGNGFDQETLSEVLGSNPCTPDLDSANGCLMVLPLATAGRGNGVNIEMYVVGFGVFQVYGDGRGNVAECRDHLPNPTPKYCGILIGAGQITNGTGGTGNVGSNNPYLITLVK
jgi:Flp pilus assembly protein TadG